MTTKKSVYNDTDINNQRKNLNNVDNQKYFAAMHAGYQHSTKHPACIVTWIHYAAELS